MQLVKNGAKAKEACTVDDKLPEEHEDPMPMNSKKAKMAAIIRYGENAERADNQPFVAMDLSLWVCAQLRKSKVFSPDFPGGLVPVEGARGCVPSRGSRMSERR